MQIPLCPNTPGKTKYTDVTIGQFPWKNVYVVIQYGCGAVLISDENRFCNVCPDCGAGWFEFDIDMQQPVPLGVVAKLIKWHPPLEYKAASLSLT